MGPSWCELAKLLTKFPDNNWVNTPSCKMTLTVVWIRSCKRVNSLSVIKMTIWLKLVAAFHRLTRSKNKIWRVSVSKLMICCEDEPNLMSSNNTIESRTMSFKALLKRIMKISKLCSIWLAKKLEVEEENILIVHHLSIKRYCSKSILLKKCAKKEMPQTFFHNSPYL